MAETSATTILSRNEARATGLKRYFTGKPCKHGHIAERFTSDATCIVCSALQSQKPAYKDARREYHRTYRANNPEKVAAAAKAHREANLPRIRERSRQWKLANPEKHRSVQKAYWERNKEKRAAGIKTWQQANPDKTRAALKRYRQKVRATPKGKLNDAIRASVTRLMAKGAKGGRKTFALLGYSVDDLRSHLEAQFLPGMTWDNYGLHGWHIDHIIPLTAFNYEAPDHIDFRRAGLSQISAHCGHSTTSARAQNWPGRFSRALRSSRVLEPNMAQMVMHLRVRWPLRQRLFFWFFRQWVRIGGMFPEGMVQITVDTEMLAKGWEYRDEMRKQWRPLGE